MMSLWTGQKERLRRLWALSWPAIIEQVLGTMVSYVDTAMVGVLGAVGSAAVSVDGPPIWLITGILVGVGVGYSVQVSNAVGAKDPERVRSILRQAFLAALVCGLIACGIYELLGGSIPKWLGAKPEVLPHAANYIRIYAAAMPLGAFMAIFSPILRCMGNTRTPLMFNTATNLLNLILNWFLIYPTRQWHGILFHGAGWGVEGAGIATAVSIAVTGIAACVCAFREQGYETSLKGRIRPDPVIIHRAVQLGLPSAVERVIVNLGQIAMTALVGHALTTAAMAANHIAVVAEGLCYLPAYGIGYAAVALVGQSVGAKNREDAEAYGTLTAILGFGMCLATGIALFLFAPLLTRLFNTDLTVTAEAALALRTVAFAEPFFAISIILSNALRGANDVTFPMAVGLVTMWAVRAPLSCLFVLEFQWGLQGIWGAMAMDIVLRGILCAVRWRNGKWVKMAGLETVAADSIFDSRQESSTPQRKS